MDNIRETITEFSKGITFFRDDVQRQKNDIKFIQRNYFESVMYDQIYNNRIGIPDDGHITKLQESRRIYNTYFPKQIIHIELQFSAMLCNFRDYPVIIIFELYEEDNYNKTVLFRKKLKDDNTYEETVSCIYIDKKNKTETITKQSFDTINEFVIDI